MTSVAQALKPAREAPGRFALHQAMAAGVNFLTGLCGVQPALHQLFHSEHTHSAAEIEVTPAESTQSNTANNDTRTDGPLAPTIQIGFWVRLASQLLPRKSK